MERKIRKLPVDKETHKLLNNDPLYYVSNSPLVIKRTNVKIPMYGKLPDREKRILLDEVKYLTRILNRLDKSTGENNENKEIQKEI